MKQISTKEIVDLFAYNKDSAVLVEKRPLPGNAQYKVNYSVVNFATGEQEVITKSAYLLRKFGSAFQKISTEIPNFVQCDAAVLYDRRVLVIYPNGEAGIFDREGTLEFAEGSRKNKVVSLTEEGRQFADRYALPAQGAEQRAFDALEPWEQREIMRLIGKFSQVLGDECEAFKQQVAAESQMQDRREGESCDC